VPVEIEAEAGFVNCTVACGTTFATLEEGGTFAVSFLRSVDNGTGTTRGLVAGFGGMGVTGVVALAGIVGCGAAGADGAAGGMVGGRRTEAGAGLAGGLIAAGELGGVIKAVAAGAEKAGVALGGRNTVEGGCIAAGATGGLGTAGMEGGRGIAGTPIAEGVIGAGMSGADEAFGGGTRTGFGGRLIMAVSRGLEVTGPPSRRAGRTIRTVSFFGSGICSLGGC